MSIEIRNFNPTNNAIHVSINSDVEFDIVGLDDYDIDINTLNVTIATNSKIDNDTHIIDYDYMDNEISYVGNSKHYHVRVNPSIPFDLGLNVTISVNVSGTDENGDPALMEEYESSFSTYYNGIVSDFRYAFINACESIPVYNEVLRKNSTTAPTIFDSAFFRWNNDKFLKIELNNVIIQPDDTDFPYTINFDNGTIEFDSALDYNDEVTASYTFAFFSDEQINSFFKQATAQWSMLPPYGGPRSIYSAYTTARHSIMVGASLLAFRELLFQLAIQERRIIFDNASQGDGWTQVKDLFKMLHDAFEKDWDALKEAKKVKLPSIASIVTPAYTLPGGRSRMFRYLYK